ncbi:reverse transcriptase domain-containing protein [Tanacetum coccineum]
MWSNTRVVAPTPSSAIIQRPISNNFDIKEEAVMLRTFPFSLSEEAKTWINELDEGTITSWNELREAFVSRYFSPAKFKRILNENHSFYQLGHETLIDAWLRMKKWFALVIDTILAKDSTMHIPYMNAKTFAYDVLPNHVDDKELKSMDDVENGSLIKKEIKKDANGVPKELKKE